MLEDQTYVPALKAYIAASKADNERLVAQLSQREAELAGEKTRADKATADLAVMAQQVAGLTMQLSQREAELASEKARAYQAIAELTAITQRPAEPPRPRWLP